MFIVIEYVLIYCSESYVDLGLLRKLLLYKQIVGNNRYKNSFVCPIAQSSCFIVCCVSVLKNLVIVYNFVFTIIMFFPH